MMQVEAWPTYSAGFHGNVWIGPICSQKETPQLSVGSGLQENTPSFFDGEAPTAIGIDERAFGASTQ